MNVTRAAWRRLSLSVRELVMWWLLSRLTEVCPVEWGRTLLGCKELAQTLSMDATGTDLDE